MHTLNSQNSRLSQLQKYILLHLYHARGRTHRDPFMQFYAKRKKLKSSPVKIVTKALERMIDREFLVGYGVRTPHKWYIKEVRLTPRGKKVAAKLFSDKQQKLPIKIAHS